jgi:NAD(P)H-dependent FMN reductase
MRIPTISGSARRDSLNTRLARLIVELRPDDRATVHADLDQLPFYDADLEAAGTGTALATLLAGAFDRLTADGQAITA